jgi:hypothetical protein
MIDAVQPFDPSMIRVAIDQARQAARQIDDLRAANARTIKTLETALNQAVKGGLKTPSVGVVALLHRREHRPGFPSRIASDPELEAFICARIERLTYAQIVAEVADHFPPARRTSMTALSRWWKASRPISADPS